VVPSATSKKKERGTNSGKKCTSLTMDAMRRKEGGAVPKKVKTAKVSPFGRNGKNRRGGGRGIIEREKWATHPRASCLTRLAKKNWNLISGVGNPESLNDAAR